YPYQISGGQKQRTAASRAIISKPNIILADEPTGALDSKSATDLLESLKDLNEQDKATILMVTHDAYAASYCNRVLFIKDGKIFTGVVKGKRSRKEFFSMALDVLSALGGGANDVIEVSTEKYYTESQYLFCLFGDTGLQDGYLL